MTEIGRSSRAIATGQHGLDVRRREIAGAVDLAVDDALRSRDQSGYRIRQLQLELLRGLMISVGDPVWAVGPTAGALHGFDEYWLQPPFHLAVPRGRHVNRIGNVIHTVQYLPPIDRETAHGLNVTSPARTIIELGRDHAPERITLALDSALRDGGTTENHLHARIAELRSKGRHGIPKLLAVIEGIELSRGGHSWLERRFLELMGSAGLPRPVTQEVLTRAKDRLVRVDCRFPGTNLIVEVLGYRYHRTKEQMQRDADRANQLTLEGWIVLQFTYTHVTETPDHVVAFVTDGLARSMPRAA